MADLKASLEQQFSELGKAATGKTTKLPFV